MNHLVFAYERVYVCLYIHLLYVSAWGKMGGRGGVTVWFEN